MGTTADDLEIAEDASDPEVARYEKAFLATRRTLDECIRNLMIKEAIEEDPEVRSELVEKRSDLETQRTNLIRANIAFHAMQATMTPPSVDLVNDLQALATTAVALTTGKATAAAIVRLATSALNDFAQIQNIGAT
jgi:hypothetical protein